MILSTINDILWTYLLIACLLGCALYFTIRCRFVQFRMIGEMFRLLGDSASMPDELHKEEDKRRHISSFQAFAISLASRVGTGNLAGVASAIAVGGPGAVFWMWVIALFGSSSAFIESTLAQLYKIKGRNSFIGGPAYYMQFGLHRRWMGVLFAVLITLTFGFAYNSLQSNTICEAMSHSFDWDPMWVGIVLTVMTLLIIFGGIQRIARVSGVVVPLMAIGYILLSIGVVVLRIGDLPAVFQLIIDRAFGWEQALGGGVGVAMMQGIKRGLFSNEAGEGSTPNAAATATVTHPVKQGLIQALGVFTDTLIICSSTAFIILFSGVPIDGSLDGVQLTQQALTAEIGNIGNVFVAIAIFFFAFTSILGNYYYGEANIAFITNKRWAIQIYRFFVAAFVMFGALTTLQVAWNMADLMMALMTLCNLVAIVLLSKYVFILLKDYRAQKRAGKDPVFDKRILPADVQEDIQAWK